MIKASTLKEPLKIIFKDTFKVTSTLFKIMIPTIIIVKILEELGFIEFICIYAVFPGPIFPDMPSTYYTASLMAAILFMIPIGLMLFFWSLNPPRSDIKKR